MHSVFRHLLLFLLLSGAVCLQAAPKPQTGTLNFSHKLHVVTQEIECETCHSSVNESVAGTDDLLPDMETCADCHDVEDEETCSTCHKTPGEIEALPRIQAYSPKFSHKRHLSSGITCITCHQSITKDTTGQLVDLPLMKQCVSCHQQKIVSASCQTCHQPGDNLKPKSHGQGFIHEHALLATTTMQDPTTQLNCTSCHSDNYCQDCHEGDNLTRRTHPLNYEYTHSFDARANERECLSCHEDRSFCADCHQENNVLPHSHTAGWAIPEVGGRHKEEAQGNLDYCMTCHEQNADRICTVCHKNKK